MNRAACLLVGLVACAGGGGGGAADPRYPARPEGCDVRAFEEAPSVPTDNLGPVRARCSADIPLEDCLRTLKDQVCRLGGDVVWGVPAKPTVGDGENVWSGRAAHTKAR